VVYVAEPASTSQDGLNLLASWAATLDQTQMAEATSESELHQFEKQDHSG
jgi:hypothetical protein